MHPRFPTVVLRVLMTLALIGLGPAAAAEAPCRAVSSVERRVLVELFTSDGCSSCPPANHWLSSELARPGSPVIPVSLHVTYWNHLGWRDAFSASFFDERQDWYAQRATNRFPYTPELIRNGHEWSGWRRSAPEAVSATEAASVQLQLDVRRGSQASLDVQVILRAPGGGAPANRSDSQLVVYLYEDGIVQRPDAGELRGAMLRHDHVVRAWQTLDRPAFGEPHVLPFVLPPQADPGRIGFVAFLQDRSTGEVLQALDLRWCGGAEATAAH